MFEEITVQAAQSLIVLFWLLLAFIFITAITYSKTKKPTHTPD